MDALSDMAPSILGEGVGQVLRHYSPRDIAIHRSPFFVNPISRLVRGEGVRSARSAVNISRRPSSCPRAFTEHGAIMAATVLNSPRAVEMSVFVVRAFVRLREHARGHAEITKRLDALERKVTAATM